MKKSPIQKGNSLKQRDKLHQEFPSVRVTAINILVWLKRKRGIQPSHSPPQQCNQTDNAVQEHYEYIITSFLCKKKILKIEMHICLHESCGIDLGLSIAMVTHNKHAIGVVKPVYGITTFPLTAKDV